MHNKYMNFLNRLFIAPVVVCCSVMVLAVPANSQAKYKTPTVLYYGDSLAAEAAPYVRDIISANNKAVLVNRTYPGSSPCDWTPALALDLSRGTPSAVIIETFGNNISACQIHNGVRARGGGSAYWLQYQRDLENFMSRLAPQTPVWLTAAPAASNDLAGGVSHKALMLALMQKLAANRPNTFAIDAGHAVETSSGGYAASMACLVSEDCSNYISLGMNRMHAYDGLHFCPAIRKATIALLRHCPVYASGAWRFGTAQATPVVRALGL